MNIETLCADLPSCSDELSSKGVFYLKLSEVKQILDVLQIRESVLSSINQIDGSNGKRTLREHILLNDVLVSAISNKPTSVSILVEKFDVPIATVSRLVSGFIHDGIVREQVDEDDRRKRYLLITPRAIANVIDRAASATVQDCSNRQSQGGAR